MTSELQSSLLYQTLDHHQYKHIHTVGDKKRGTLFLFISSSVIDQFSKFFHWHNWSIIGKDMDISKVHVFYGSPCILFL